jgi:anti-sigma B factor antagonist
VTTQPIDGSFEANAAPSGFGISQEALEDGVWLFTIQGEVDLATADDVRDALLGPANDGAGTIIVDLARCSFIDSSGLRALLEARRALVEDDGARGFLIAAPAEQPGRLLEMTSLETVMPIFATREAAEAAARNGSADGASPASS